MNISKTESGRIILGAIAAAESEWRRKIIQFIADQIPKRISQTEHVVLRLRLQSPPTTFKEIGRQIDYSGASAVARFNKAVRILKCSVSARLYQSQIWFPDVLDEIREAVLSIPMPEIPTPALSLKERQARHRKAVIAKRLREKRTEELQRRLAAARVEYNRLQERISSIKFAKLKKANYPDYRITSPH